MNQQISCFQQVKRRFKVEFTINEKVKTENITSKAHKKVMKIESINVLKHIPKPQYTNGKPTNTPISFLMTVY